MSEQQHRETKQARIMNYPFLSGALALDLVNTEVIVRGSRYDLLCAPGDVANGGQEVLTHYPDRENVQQETQAIAWSLPFLEKIKRLRSAIRTLCTNLVEQQPLDQVALSVFNEILAMGYPALDFVPGGDLIPIYRAREASQGPILLTIALSAFHLLTRAEKHRLHKCKNDRCILFFYDTSKGGARQWCSLGCMNRSRSIHHYRQRQNGYKEHIE